jgi:PKHD-type hydroxylase
MGLGLFAGFKVGKRSIRDRNHSSGNPIFIRQAVPRKVCNEICGYWSNAIAEIGGMESEYDSARRRCNVIGVDYASDITNLINPFIAEHLPAIQHHFQFDVSAFGEAWQLCLYSVKDRFDWHLDSGPGEPSTRKISLVIQLSSSSAYFGGNLEFCPGGIVREGRAQGTLIAFPSYYAHRVGVVTSGRRMSLVGWVHGPPFR